MLGALEAWPSDSLTRAASLSFFVIVLVINILWITIKIILWSHGYKGWFGSKDMRQLRELALVHPESAASSAYSILRYSLLSLFTLLFVLPLTLLGISYLIRHTH